MSLLFLANILALLFSFFVIGALLGAAFSKPFREKIIEIVGIRPRRDIELAKLSCNPILSPGAHPWNAEAVLNPAAVVLNDRTHLVYRAIGMDGVSRLGYASSANGITFDERLPYPVYTAQNPRAGFAGPRRYSPVMYPSGGSWGGCEDPRMVAIGDRVYVLFNAFDGWDFIRVAAMSIAKDDFLAKRWNWSKPNLLSRPGERHKNWVLFPEKIRGKFVVLHSIAPKIEVAYVNAVDEVGITEPFIASWVGARADLPEREGVWDSFVRSAGPPPVKTAHGWLLFYHALNKHEMSRYKLGAMLLDLDDPTKVLYRSNEPILMPDEYYENNGKPGIVYACGAVVRGDMLYIYYGGADKVVCVATAHLDAFLRALIAGKDASLASAKLQTA